MSAPSMPPDNSAAIRQSELAAEEKRRGEEKIAADQRKQELLGLRNTAQTQGRTSARDYFSQQGIDPDRHSSAIESAIASKMAGIAPDDPNPGSYFNDIGQGVFSAQEAGQRGKASRGLDAIFSPNFETQRLPYTIDDPYLSGIDAEQRSEADAIIRNMLDRGVITPTGYEAASGDLDKQGAGARSRLTEVGTGLIGSGQQSLREVANRGRQAASNLQLDSPFDPYQYGGEADQLQSDFLSTLRDSIQSRLTGNLYQTAGLGAIAGAGQGAQNTKFNPNALTGIIDEEDERDDEEEDEIF